MADIIQRTRSPLGGAGLPPREPGDHALTSANLEGFRLSARLHVADACWLFGLTETAWRNAIKQEATHTVEPSVAILLRVLIEWPHLSLIPCVPDVASLFESMKRLYAGMDLRVLARCFGVSRQSVSKWVSGEVRPARMNSRLLSIFSKLFLEACLRSRRGGAKFIRTWGLMVQELFKRDLEMPQECAAAPVSQDSPTSGESWLSVISKFRGLRTTLLCGEADLRWLLGVTESEWRALCGRHVPEASPDKALVILIHALSTYPNASLLSPTCQLEELYRHLAVNQPLLDQKRFGVMFGSDGTAAWKWLNGRSTPSRSTQHLCSTFSQLYLPALRGTSRATPAGRDVIMRWDQIVRTEANSRGLQDVFQSTSWRCAANGNSLPRMRFEGDVAILCRNDKMT